MLAWGFLDQHHAIVGAPFDPPYGEADAIAALDSIVAAAVGDGCAPPPSNRWSSTTYAAAALLDASDGADLLVVGARGLGRVRRLLLGSVSQQCLHHATCPVAIVRDGTQQSDERIARIVVGIDGSDTAGRALEWALEAGRLHQATVEVVHAWTFPYGAGQPIRRRRLRLHPVEDAARRTLDAAVESADTSGLPAPVTRTLAIGSAAAAFSKQPKAPTWWSSDREASAVSRAWCSDQ